MVPCVNVQIARGSVFRFRHVAISRRLGTELPVRHIPKSTTKHPDLIDCDLKLSHGELAPVSLDTTLSTRTEKEWPS